MALGGRQWTGRHALAASAAVGLTVLLWVLKGGVPTNLIGAGTLTTQSGAATTTTRASNKTCCTNAACSTVVTLSAGQPCVDSAGLNVEGSATNLITYSQAIATDGAHNWNAAGNATATAASAVGPDGTQTASLIALSGGNPGTKVMYQNYGALTASTAYTCSVWLWTDSGTYQVRLGRTNQASWGSATVSPTLTLTTTPFRYSLTYTTAAGETASAFTVGSENKTPFLAADGSFYAWGAQCELGSFATSYIATTGTTATRAADAPNAGNVTGAPRSLAATATLATRAGTQYLLEAYNGATDQWAMFVPVTGVLRCQYYNGSFFLQDSSGTVSANTPFTACCSYDGTTLKACLNGTCSSSAQTFSLASSYSSLMLGTEHDSSSLYEWGSLTNVRVGATASCP